VEQVVQVEQTNHHHQVEDQVARVLKKLIKLFDIVGIHFKKQKEMRIDQLFQEWLSLMKTLECERVQEITASNANIAKLIISYRERNLQ
jgi:hypothetical protein